MNGEVYLKYNWIWILIAIYVVLRFTKKLWMPLIKGSLGEATVSGILGFLDKDKYKVIHNVMIPSGLSEITFSADVSYGTTVTWQPRFSSSR